MKTTNALAVLVFAFPLTALADVSGNPSLGSNGTLNLDTGAIATSGGDILFNGSTIVPQGNAKVLNLGVRYDFASLSSDFVVQQAAAATSAPIAANLLTGFDVFVVVTNGGSTAKVWVIGGVQNFPVLGPSIGLQFTTFTGLAPGVGFVTEILNNSSLVQPGYPNYGIAPSSLFIVRGGSLADPVDPVLQSSARTSCAFPALRRFSGGASLWGRCPAVWRGLLASLLPMARAARIDSAKSLREG